MYDVIWAKNSPAPWMRHAAKTKSSWHSMLFYNCRCMDCSGCWPPKLLDAQPLSVHSLSHFTTFYLASCRYKYYYFLLFFVYLLTAKRTTNHYIQFHEMLYFSAFEKYTYLKYILNKPIDYGDIPSYICFFFELWIKENKFAVAKMGIKNHLPICYDII